MPWIQIALFVIGMVLSYTTRPKPKVPKPAAFEDFSLPQASEGTPQIMIFGDVWIEDWMVIGMGNFRTKSVKA